VKLNRPGENISNLMETCEYQEDAVIFRGAAATNQSAPAGVCTATSGRPVRSSGSDEMPFRQNARKEDLVVVARYVVGLRDSYVEEAARG
jgi:hypothetical protein